MGKYSLDAFEVHPLVKLRPVMAAPEPDCFRMLEVFQSELEPETGVLLAPPAVGTGKVILHLHMAQNADLADVCGFVRRMGCCYEGGRQLAGVLMTESGFSGAELDRLVQAYQQGFEATFLLAEPGRAVAESCLRTGVKFGLWLHLERGILELRRSIARSNLARNWEDCPVYIFSGGELTEEALDAARRWHADGADVPAVLGARMTLRRMMFPKDLTAGGPLPLRMWWQNLGTAPMYRDVELCLELRMDQQRFPVALSEKMQRPGMGDSTFNTTAQLPQIRGELELWCGLRCGGGMLPLSAAVPEDHGMYRLGQVTLDDQPRPYLASMWEETYADGYYPLEDPAQPE